VRISKLSLGEPVFGEKLLDEMLLVKLSLDKLQWYDFFNKHPIM